MNFMYQKPGCEARGGLNRDWVVSVDFCEAGPEQRVLKVRGRLVRIQGETEASPKKESPNPESCLG